MKTTLALLIVTLIILFFLSSSSKEPFSAESINIILLGDSILENSNYASPSVANYLSQHNRTNVFNFAKDNSTIEDVSVNTIPDDLNQIHSIIFLSVGGNDILQNKPDPEQNYDILLQQLKTKMNKTTIVLVNIYYPSAFYYRKVYADKIHQWNAFLAGKDEDVLDLTKFMTDPSDFAYDIEPSVQGGEKISRNILNKCQAYFL